MLLKDFNDTIDSWIEALEQYSFTQLCTKSAPTSWSMGQLYAHLINDTNYYIEQIKICVTTNDNVNKEATAFAKTLFFNNAFPDEMIEGAPTNSSIPQPGNKEQLMSSLLHVKIEMNHLATLISTSAFKGKTKHTGLNYFSANEWMQFAAIHFRHHLRQKKRIDDFLKINC